MVQQPAGIEVFPSIGEQLVKPWLIASTEGSTKFLPTFFESPECVSGRRIRSPYRYRFPTLPAVHTSNRGFTAIEVVSPVAVRPILTVSVVLFGECFSSRFGYRFEAIEIDTAGVIGECANRQEDDNRFRDVIMDKPTMRESVHPSAEVDSYE